ncbi:hypothetical protein Enr10x_29760 [Gimesia panareensis]|uniref:Uncharacterized protein n=1 Tax=Gimesia panareensis TaxID=2527978 RepID=A0A517Q488_9PLAN|nr:DUF6610 family protein [Gimesia panareensis]QDT26446.1 hypothetical protein Enr10x_17500 [Gimesia panareensis]QDT27658.1 hypothetical protein Enr10x_29760 [Gimesia panareensis]
MEILKFVAHSKKAIGIALKYGWHPAARYTNMRDVKTFKFNSIGFLDIDWKNYNFKRHVEIAAKLKPKLTIARDVECIFHLDEIIKEAECLLNYSDHVAIVPKDPKLNGRLNELIPSEFLLAYSVPTKYGGTKVTVESFDRPVHLLGGRPDVQRRLADTLKVFSIDCNRFTFDAKFGDYFDGDTFRPHPDGGYENCLKASIKNINPRFPIWISLKPLQAWTFFDCNHCGPPCLKQSDFSPLLLCLCC